MQKTSFVNTTPFSKILICDDHPVAQLGIKCALEEMFSSNNFTFFRVQLGQEALQILDKEAIDLLVLDLRLPDLSGFDILKVIKEQMHPVKVLVMTGEENLHVLSQLLRYNINAILLKSYTTETMKEALDHIARNQPGDIYMDPTLESQLCSESERKYLSPREFEVLELLLKGLSNKAIGEILKCSPETVKSHRAKIREKTNLKNRDELAEWFYKGNER